jgi:DHA1 family bicyclomycin/chloramphenicol resistance-like MFS transporter
MVSMSLSYILGTFCCRWLLLRISVQQCVAVAGFVTLLAGILMLFMAYWGATQTWFGAWAVMLPMNIFLLGHGVHQPCGQSGCIAPFPEMAGSASALNGFTMMVVAFGIGTWIGTHMANPLETLAQGLSVTATCVALIAWFGVRNLPSPPKPSFTEQTALSK